MAAVLLLWYTNMAAGTSVKTLKTNIYNLNKGDTTRALNG